MKRSTAAALFIAVCGVANVGNGQSNEPAPRMEKYVLVLLRRGSAWTPEETAATRELQKQHLGHFRKMAEAGKLMIAGPFGDQPDPTLRGMCIYKTSSVEEAKALAEADPAVKAGRLKVEAMTWYVEKGYLAFPKARPSQ
jgi:uncharacterized protein YciI